MIFPDMYVKNAYELPYKEMYNRGFRGIIFDIDNTVALDNGPADDRCRKLFKDLEAMGYKTMIVSNNDEPRVKSFADDVGSGYVFKAAKPSKKGYYEALRKMGLKKDRVFLAGDQIFTDILGAKRCGIFAVMVGKLNWKERPHIYLKRILEVPIMGVYFLMRCFKK
ncbi:MAG: YqeG family HAD IIIA-type phosphatase [Lachnospiraceae bacterium]|nr:YqeG family HAD IIIA-type phosphatase [Lachnospiraceae bacterium]